MKVQAIKILNYRSIESAEVVGCGNLNVFIGKNNAGKSNILASIELIQSHLSKAVIASKWIASRPSEEFYGKQFQKGIKIAVQFALPENVNSNLRSILQSSFPNLERAAAELEGYDSVVFVMSGNIIKEKAFLFIEQIVIGELNFDSKALGVNGTTLLSVDKEAAYELFQIQELINSHSSDIQSLSAMISRGREMGYLFNSNSSKETNRANMVINNFLGSGNTVNPDVRKELVSFFINSENSEEFIKNIEVLIVSTNARIAESLKKETVRPFTTFAGETRTQPEYVGYLMNAYGSVSLLHLRETKVQIGRDEAAALLKLKTARGSAARLKSVQNTVRSLLGVEIDAFQPEDSLGRSQPAEMDVDDFLAEANGAGVREALRLILDLQLKQPELVLIEEPEVHLHPGLEYAMYSYLRDKSKTQQIFVTTHSTNFVDSVSFQNIYLVDRGEGNTKIAMVDKSDGALTIPTSLGLRLSTVFMYDRLLFVEGPSDEAVLREFARILGIDLAGANMNFVQMGGVTNFAHYAAENTLSLLSRKNLKLWFLTDRDERSDDDVQAMMLKLGGNAQLRITEFRDLENCLLSPKAVHQFIAYKLESLGGNLPSVEEVSAELDSAAVSLRDEVIARRVNSKLLKPIYLQNRKAVGDMESRLRSGIVELQKRLDSIASVQESITNSTCENWEANAKRLTPGAEILDKCCQKFGVHFKKDEGDSARLASYMPKEAISREIVDLLQEVSAT